MKKFMVVSLCLAALLAGGCNAVLVGGAICIGDHALDGQRIYNPGSDSGQLTPFSNGGFRYPSHGVEYTPAVNKDGELIFFERPQR